MISVHKWIIKWAMHCVLGAIASVIYKHCETFEYLGEKKVLAINQQQDIDICVW